MFRKRSLSVEGKVRTWLARSAGVVLLVFGGFVFLTRTGFPQGPPVGLGQPKATAFALVHVAATPPHNLADYHRTEAPGEFGRFCRTQTTIVKSPFVCAAALRDPKIARLPTIQAQADPTAWLGEQLHVDFPGDTEVMRIALTGSNPGEITKLVNAVTDAYIRESVNVEHNERLDRVARGKDIYNDALDGLKKKREKLAELSLEAGLEGPEVVRDASWRTVLADCERDLYRVRLEKAGIEARLARRKGRNPAGAEAAGLEEALAGLEAQEHHLAQEAEKLHNKGAAIQRATRELEALRDEIAYGERYLHQIGDALGQLSIELKAPKRIKLLGLADVPKVLRFE
jgi:hypothetical protein